MGKKSNVNPDHYKTAGRGRQGEDIVQERHRERYARAQRRSGKGAPHPATKKSRKGMR